MKNTRHYSCLIRESQGLRPQGVQVEPNLINRDNPSVMVSQLLPQQFILVYMSSWPSPPVLHAVMRPFCSKVQYPALRVFPEFINEPNFIARIPWYTSRLHPDATAKKRAATQWPLGQQNPERGNAVMGVLILSKKSWVFYACLNSTQLWNYDL